MRSNFRAINVKVEDISPMPKNIADVKQFLWEDEICDLQEGYFPRSIPEILKDKWGRIDPEMSLKRFEELKADFYRALRKLPLLPEERMIELCLTLEENLKSQV